MIRRTVSHCQGLEKLVRMCVVQMVADTKLNPAIALKFRSDSLSDDRQALERFQCEAQAASALNHPNACTLYETPRTSRDERLRC
jgi:eukaryotic-like serine/threonine-protein kinase